MFLSYQRYFYNYLLKIFSDNKILYYGSIPIIFIFSTIYLFPKKYFIFLLLFSFIFIFSVLMLHFISCSDFIINKIKDKNKYIEDNFEILNTKQSLSLKLKKNKITKKINKKTYL